MHQSFLPRSGRKSPRVRPVCLLFCLCLAGLTGCGEGHAPPQPVGQADKSYSYGTLVTFGQNGNAEPYKVSGWSGTESDSTWTEGAAAVLEFKVEPSDEPVMLKAVLSGFVKPPELPTQAVEIMVNGESVARWEIAAKGEAFTTIPVAALKKEAPLKVEFVTPKAASPASFGQSSDGRRLGIRLYSLVLEKQSP